MIEYLANTTLSEGKLYSLYYPIIEFIKDENINIEFDKIYLFKTFKFFIYKINKLIDRRKIHDNTASAKIKFKMIDYMQYLNLKDIKQAEVLLHNCMNIFTSFNIEYSFKEFTVIETLFYKLYRNFNSFYINFNPQICWEYLEILINEEE